MNNQQPNRYPSYPPPPYPEDINRQYTLRGDRNVPQILRNKEQGQTGTPAPTPTPTPTPAPAHGRTRTDNSAGVLKDERVTFTSMLKSKIGRKFKKSTNGSTETKQKSNPTVHAVAHTADVSRIQTGKVPVQSTKTNANQISSTGGREKLAVRALVKVDSYLALASDYLLKAFSQKQHGGVVTEGIILVIVLVVLWISVMLLNDVQNWVRYLFL